ncbi:MAG: UTP--glucose-1-phosphate uridylyltransferase [Candidatus Njordarchaeales archaeon]
MIKKAIIPAAGYGTRMLPATIAYPKVMFPLLTKPIILYVVEEVIGANIREILIIKGWKGNIMEVFFQEKPMEMINWLKERGKKDLAEKLLNGVVPEDVKIMFHEQKILNGLGGAILLGEEFVSDEHFVVPLGDNIIVEENVGSLLRDMIKVHEELNSSVTLCVAPVPHHLIPKFGIIGYKRVFEVDSIKVYEVSKVVEKPSIEEAPSNLGIVGRYVMSPETLKYLREAPVIKGEISETDAFQAMINNGHPVYAVDIGDRRWYDVGLVEGYVKAMLDLALTKLPESGKIKKWLKELLSKID